MVWPSQGSSTCGYRQPLRLALLPTSAPCHGSHWFWVHQSHSLTIKGLPSNGGEVWGEGALPNPSSVGPRGWSCHLVSILVHKDLFKYELVRKKACPNNASNSVVLLWGNCKITKNQNF